MIIKKTKKRLANVLVPVADRTAREFGGNPCLGVFFHQPKLPKKLMHTVK